MVDDAERYAEEDKKMHDKITAKNEYESLVHSGKQTITEASQVTDLTPEE
jgi:molecular chaperone DnaK